MKAVGGVYYLHPFNLGYWSDFGLGFWTLPPESTFVYMLVPVTNYEAQIQERCNEMVLCSRGVGSGGLCLGISSIPLTFPPFGGKGARGNELVGGLTSWHDHGMQARGWR